MRITPRLPQNQKKPELQILAWKMTSSFPLSLAVLDLLPLATESRTFLGIMPFADFVLTAIPFDFVSGKNCKLFRQISPPRVCISYAKKRHGGSVFTMYSISGIISNYTLWTKHHVGGGPRRVPGYESTLSHHGNCCRVVHGEEFDCRKERRILLSSQKPLRFQASQSREAVI